MDYTKGARDTNRRAAVHVLMDKLGNHVAGPMGAVFTELHLVELMQDGDFYALSSGEGGDGEDRAVKFLKKIVKPRAWKKKVKDCENRTNKGIGDLTDEAEELDWGANPLVVALAYDSISLGKGVELWDGYHVAFAVVKWNPAKKDYEVWIVEPKTLTAPEIWRRPEEEVKVWVLFTGR